MKRKQTVLILLILLFTISSLSVMANSDPNKINNQLKGISAEQQKLNNAMKQNQTQQQSVAQQLQNLENQIIKTESEMTKIQNDIKVTENKVKETLEQLMNAESHIDGKTDLLGDRINVMYRNGNIGYAEVILSSKSFAELMTNVDMVKRIVQHDVDLLKQLKEQRDLIEDKKVQLENHKSQLIIMKSSMEEKKQSLQVNRGEQERLRSRLQNDKVEIAKQLDALEREARLLEDQLRKLQSSGAYIGGQMQWPVPGYSRISSPYGNRIHPILKTPRFHSGIDIPAPTGTPIVAAAQGKVVVSRDQGGYGRTVVIDHGGGIMTLYAHNSKLLVSEGQQVTRGQRIALAGSTGMSTGPHLHFEVRENGKTLNPTTKVKY